MKSVHICAWMASRSQNESRPKPSVWKSDEKDRSYTQIALFQVRVKSNTVMRTGSAHQSSSCFAWKPCVIQVLTPGCSHYSERRTYENTRSYFTSAFECEFGGQGRLLTTCAERKRADRKKKSERCVFVQRSSPHDESLLEYVRNVQRRRLQFSCPARRPRRFPPEARRFGSFPSRASVASIQAKSAMVGVASRMKKPSTKFFGQLYGVLFVASIGRKFCVFFFLCHPNTVSASNALKNTATHVPHGQSPITSTRWDAERHRPLVSKQQHVWTK